MSSSFLNHGWLVTLLAAPVVEGAGKGLTQVVLLHLQLACAHTRCLREGWLEVRKRRRIAGWSSWKMRWAEVLQDGTFAIYKSASKRTNDLRYPAVPCCHCCGSWGHCRDDSVQMAAIRCQADTVADWPASASANAS